MSYSDRFGSTVIITDKRNNLRINWDSDSYEGADPQRYPVFLFTPHMGNTDEHFHIPLELEQAKVLRGWLNDYIDDVEKHLPK